MRDTDYLEYDDLGLKEVRCMVCKKPVAKRTYVQMDKRDSSGQLVNVMTVQRLPQWRQLKFNVVLQDGTKGYLEPIVCASCLGKNIDKDALLSEVVKGWEMGLRNKNPDERAISEKMATMNRVALDRKEPEKKAVLVRELPAEITTG
jgi:hypothetical protein